MDKSDHNLEAAAAAGCEKNSVGSKISYATNEILLNNKKNLEVLDDTVIYNPDDRIDYEYYDVDENQAFAPNIPPIEKPAKNNMPCSDIQTSESPKSKKRKLPTFEELLESLDYNTLYLNFTKLLQFLESEKKDMCFPFVSKDYGEFFKMIVRNIGLLKSKSLDAHYRDICDKIAEAVDFKKSGFLLTYVYECRKGFQNIVLVIKKVYVTHKLEDEATSSSCSFSIMRSSQTSSDMDSNSTLSRFPSPATISNGFKIHCLRTALAFVKNDVTKTKEFPELSTDQANFMQLLLDSVVAFADFGSSLEAKELYRALWEAVRMYKLKYEFRIKCVETLGGKKNLMFEKVPKVKPGEKDINLDPPALNSRPILNKSTGIPKPEASKSEAPKPEVSKPEPPKPEASKPEPPKLVVPKPQTSKSVPKIDPESMFLQPQIPKRTYPKLTKKMRKRQLKIDKEHMLIKQMPPKFISDTLHSILAFLTDPLRIEMVFVPSKPTEREFYRKCIGWCRNCNVTRFAPEFQALQYEILTLLNQIDCQVKKPSACKINKATGMKEVVYVKPSSWQRPLYVPHSSQSWPKRRKVNLQNVLQMAATTDNTQLSSVVNLNQSFRHKKKNKKSKRDKIKYHNPVGASSGTSSRTRSWSEDSSSDTCSERGSSWDRSKVPAKAQRMTMKIMEEDSQRSRDIAEAEKLRLRRHAAFHISEVTRKEQLKEALSVPVQSDKAMRMMRGMGWSGGALGARGDGITVPLMPSLDIPRGAGFGHNRRVLPVIFPKKQKKPVTGPCFVTDKHMPSVSKVSESDIIVQKTRQILFENMTFDSILRMIMLPVPTISNVELPTPTTANAELPEPTTSKAELSEPTSNAELPEPTPNDDPQQAIIEFEDLSDPYFRVKILNGVLEFLSGKEICKSLDFCYIDKKDKIFLHDALLAFNGIVEYLGLFLQEERHIYYQIRDKFRELPNVYVKGSVNNLTQIELKKKTISTNYSQLASNLPAPGIITKRKLEGYIASFGSPCVSQKVYEFMKYRVLFLLNMLNFAKSTNREWEIKFDTLLIPRQRSFIEKVIDEINMRVRNGVTPAEVELWHKINNHVEDEFFGTMFEHKYKSVTINKFYRLQRLDRPVGDQRVWETTFKIANFTSETKLITRENIPSEPTETKPITIVITDTETDSSVDDTPTDDPIDLCDSDSCPEEYNEVTATAKVPNLPPGEDGVNLSNFLPLYENTNSPDITNNSSKNDSNSTNDSNTSDNGNNKIDSGNGNVFIDDNDNQVIDMKRDGNMDVIMNGKDNMADTEVAEYLICESYSEEVIEKGDNENNNTDIVVAQNGGNKAKVDNDHDIKMIEDSGSKNNGGENNIIDKETENVIDKEMDINDPKDKELMDVSVKVELVEAVIKVEPIEVTYKEELVEVTNEAELTTGINKCESMEVTKPDVIEVTNHRESSKDLNVAQMKEENSINPSDNQKTIEEANLEVKNDCDIVLKQEVELSQENCDTQTVDLETTGTEPVPSTAKKIKEVKSVIIIHFKHPTKKLSKGKVIEIQKQISKYIKNTKRPHLPLLMCHGFENGKLTYTCHNKKSYDWLKYTVGLVSQVEMLDITVKRMSLTVYCFINFGVKYFFKMIELYNRELSTKYWVVEKTEEYNDYVMFIIKMDKFSVNFIQASGLALFAGVDKVEFSPIWD